MLINARSWFSSKYGVLSPEQVLAQVQEDGHVLVAPGEGAWREACGGPGSTLTCCGECLCMWNRRVCWCR